MWMTRVFKWDFNGSATNVECGEAFLTMVGEAMEVFATSFAVEDEIWKMKFGIEMRVSKC